MKRLLKTADIDYNNFFIVHLNYNQSSQNQIEQVINENQDCLYSGSVYRLMYFDKQDITEAVEQFLKEDGSDISDLSNNYNYYILNSMDKIVRINNLYQCFAKSLSGIDNISKFLGQDKEANDIEVIIKCNIENGLDIDKLYNKHKNTLSTEANESYNQFKNQEEVLAKFSDSEYTIVDFNPIKDLFS